jgi:hypothetical protein
MQSWISNFTPQLTQRIRQSVFTFQSQNSLHSRPTHSKVCKNRPIRIHTKYSTRSVNLYSQSNHKSHPIESHLILSLYSQSNHKPHSIVIPLTPLGCIHSPITNLIPQTSHSLRQAVFTFQTQTSINNRPTYSVSLHSQFNHKTHSTVVPHIPSVCVKRQSTNITQQSSQSLR